MAHLESEVTPVVEEEVVAVETMVTRVTEKNFRLENVSTIKFLRDGSFIVRKIERED